MKASSRQFLRVAIAAMLCAAAACLLLLPRTLAAPKPDAQNALRIYFVDVEGGQSTLFVLPSGQSLLIDTGVPDQGGRDANRIVAAAKDAGLTKIDYVLITHYHVDHVGGVPQLAARIPIGGFIDHGVNRETVDAGTERGYEAYQDLLAKGGRTRLVVKPGDMLPLQGIQAEVVSADGAVIATPLPGAGADNTAACAASEIRPTDVTENRRSVGTMFTFGTLRILDLGDLTWDMDRQLMCPQNKLGTVDIFLVSNHGMPNANSPAMVDGIAPRVAIMNNSARKGSSPPVWDTVEKSPRLEDLWQLHYSEEGGATHNVAEPFLANLHGPDTGFYLKLTAWTDGSFDVFNARTGQSKHYAATK
jgi:beta-lactamase superfamily II metal-dependent hydrolase